MLTQLRPALVLTLLFALLTGLAYPLAVTGIGQVAFPAAANGSLVSRDGVIVGSALIGQNFASPAYFWSRPSATGPDPYNAAASTGSNYGPTDKRLVARVAASITALGGGPVAADAVETSASGLDPDISPANAMAQIARIAKARGVDPAMLDKLVLAHTDQPVFGLLGEARVNVLALNLALDTIAPLAK